MRVCAGFIQSKNRCIDRESDAEIWLVISVQRMRWRRWRKLKANNIETFFPSERERVRVCERCYLVVSEQKQCNGRKKREASS